MSKAFAIVYFAAVGALAVTAVLIWQLRCEGFGCMGVGVAWFAWVVLFLPVMALGAALWSRKSLGDSFRRFIHAAVWSQIALGAALFAAWVAKNAA